MRKLDEGRLAPDPSDRLDAARVAPFPVPIQHRPDALGHGRPVRILNNFRERLRRGHELDRDGVVQWQFAVRTGAAAGRPRRRHPPLQPLGLEGPAAHTSQDAGEARDGGRPAAHGKIAAVAAKSLFQSFEGLWQPKTRRQLQDVAGVATMHGPSSRGALHAFKISLAASSHASPRGTRIVLGLIVDDTGERCTKEGATRFSLEGRMLS